VTSPSLTEYRYITEPAALEELAPELDGASELFLDTEFESTREHTRLCLLQIGTGQRIFLVDAIKLANLKPLAPAFRSATWVLHAGTLDVPLIQRALGLTDLPRLFDTQVGYSLVSAEANVSLAYLTYVLSGGREAKAHQADDWTRRPLSPEQLTYAAKDVAGLPRLLSELKKLADALNPERFALMFEASREALEPGSSRRAPLELSSFRNAWQLGAAEQAGLRFLIEWFNRLPRDDQRDAPEPKVLFSLASRMPTTKDVLLQLKGVPRGFAQRHHKRILDGLADAARSVSSAHFVPIEPPPYATFQQFRVEAWLLQLRATISEELTVAPEFVLPSRVLRELEAAWLEVPSGKRQEIRPSDVLLAELSGFRKALFGPKLAGFCDRVPPPL
jgi:ribonuclease D